MEQKEITVGDFTASTYMQQEQQINDLREKQQLVISSWSEGKDFDGSVVDIKEDEKKGLVVVVATEIEDEDVES